jgi:hypothetical protein
MFGGRKEQNFSSKKDIENAFLLIGGLFRYLFNENLKFVSDVTL